MMKMKRLARGFLGCALAVLWGCAGAPPAGQTQGGTVGGGGAPAQTSVQERVSGGAPEARPDTGGPATPALKPTAGRMPTAAGDRAQPFVCPPAGAITTKKHFLGGLDALQIGDEGRAWEELSMALCQKPNYPVVKRLLRQIEEPPESFFGPDSVSYEVQPADSLSKISKRFYGDAFLFYALARHNRIENPSRLRPGSAIDLPQLLGKPVPVVVAPIESAPPAVKPIESVAPPTMEASPSPAPEAPDRFAEVNELQEAGRYAEASTVLEQALASDPGDTKVRGLLVTTCLEYASILQAEGRWAESRGMLARVLELAPENPQARREIEAVRRHLGVEKAYDSAVQAEQQGELEKAYGGFQKVLEGDPDHPQAQADLQRTRKGVVELLSKRAMASFRRQDLDGAIAGWDRVLEMDPDNERARLRRAEAVDLKARFQKRFE